MTKKEFIEAYQSVYIMDSVDDESQIEIIGSKKAENVSNIFKNSVIVDLEEGSCNIYQVFTYGDYDNLLTIREISRKKLLLLQALGKAYGILPDLDLDDGMGCPFIDEYVGYFNVEYDFKKIDRILCAFELALTLDKNMEIDEEYLMQHFDSEYCTYLEYEDEIKYAYRRLMGRDYCALANRFSSKLSNVNNAFIDSQGAFIVGFGEKSLKIILDYMKFQTYEVDEIYFGSYYCFARAGKLSGSFNSDYLKRINAFLEIIKVEDEDYLVYEMGQNVMVAKTTVMDFWAMIMVLKGGQDILALKERRNIQEMSNKLLPFISQKLLLEEYDFSKLDDSMFEKMCRDLLIDMGFINVRQRGKTRASDGGVDLEADMIVETLFEKQKQHWIFQCKHTKAQIDRKDISEVQDLLSEFKASGYGLFYSGMLSPQTLDRIKRNEAIRYWEKSDLEILLRKYRKTSIRYFGI